MAAAKPNFFIVGAPKSGTTALYEYLRRHPDIYMPEKKEPHFFCHDLSFGSSFGHVNDLERYLALFGGWDGEKRVGEASPWYLYSRAAAHEIHAFDPDARIIIMLRNPVDMIYASYSESFFNGTENLPTFRAALAAEAQRKAGQLIPRGAYLVDALFYSEIARYSEMVRRYINIFGDHQVHIIIFDDFKVATATIYRETLAFLDVDAAFVTDLSVINPNKRVRSALIRDLFRSPPLWFSPVLGMARKSVPISTRQAFSRFIKRLNTNYVDREQMDEALYRELQLLFGDEIEQLSLLLNRDLSHWCT